MDLGKVVDLCDRPLLCSSYNETTGEVVFGSSDHALYIIDLDKGTKAKTLYTKTKGHREWVTCVTHTKSGLVVSGSMDSKLCVWDTSSKELGCTDLLDHRGSISAVSTFVNTIISTSYDKTIRLWSSEGTKAKEISVMEGHKAAITKLADNNKHIIATGDRKGCVYVWDLLTCMQSWKMRNVHKGNINSLLWKPDCDALTSSMLLSGGQDGIVRIWDIRTRSNIATQSVHTNSKGRGAVTDIVASAMTPEKIFTFGADQRLKILDLRKTEKDGLGEGQCGCAVVKEFEMPDFVYCVKEYKDLVMCACGDGNLVGMDMNKEEMRFFNKISDNAMRCIEVTNEGQFLCGGDDGYVAIY